jgi:hypothetical protein
MRDHAMPNAKYASRNINRAVRQDKSLNAVPALCIAMPLGERPLPANLPKPALEIARKFLELLSLKHDKIGRKFERVSPAGFIPALMLYQVADTVDLKCCITPQQVHSRTPGIRPRARSFR